MPPTIDNTTDRAREEGDDADWARWEQNFRDARPVLPEAAMARIEASILRAAERVAAKPRKSRLRMWVLLLAGFLIAVNAAVVLVLMNEGNARKTPSTHAEGTGVRLMEDRFPVDVVIGPPLIASDRPILPLSENAELFDYIPREKAKPSLPVSSPGLMKGAERLCAGSLDSWRQLGLFEMHRVAGTAAPQVALFEPHVEDYHVVAGWWMLPLEAKNAQAFYGEIQRLAPSGNTADAQFWYGLYSLYLAQYENAVSPPQLSEFLQNQPPSLPSKIGNKARFDLLVALGEPRAQAALDVLTTRSYRPLLAVGAYETWNKRPAKLPIDLPVVGHDLVERLFAMRLLGRNDEALKLLRDALRIRYLNEPEDLAVLLARLGPEDAWQKLLRPLMEDEVAFIQNPPTFDQAGTHATSEAAIESSTKSLKDGVTTYLGPILNLSAGPWRVSCDKLTAFHNADQGMLLSGDGNIKVQGVIGLFGATADEVTLNTHTGELKLAGHVHLDGWTKASDVTACVITRTGEVRATE